MGFDLKNNSITPIQFATHNDERGKLLVFEEGDNGLPFAPRRSFYIYDVPNNAVRAGHAVDSALFIVPLKGQVIVSNDEGGQWLLKNSTTGLYIPPYQYIELSHFSADAIVAVHAAKTFAETNYFSLNELRKEK